MNRQNDPMGRAIAEYHKTGTGARLRVFSPMFEEDEIPLKTLFRTFGEMPEIERTALGLAKGRTLDVGAASGCHSLVLQQHGIDVTAIDISPLSVETMKQRGVKKVLEQDFFALEGSYDTILMLMNGIGIVGTLERLPEFFRHLDKILAPGGQLLCDSSDLCYLFEDESLPEDHGVAKRDAISEMDNIVNYPVADRYYGELSYTMQYRDTIGEPFNWLFIDAGTLKRKAAENGYRAEVIAEGEHYDYLARITKK